MNTSKNSLSEKLSSLLAALRNSQPHQSNSDGTTATSFQANCDAQQATTLQKDSGIVIETIPELLDFLRSSTNPKVIRDVVARFLSNPSLSENERELIRTKVREKIEEEKLKKKALKMLGTSTSTYGSCGTSSQYIVDNLANSAAKTFEQTMHNESQMEPFNNGWSYDVSMSMCTSSVFADGIPQPPVNAQPYYLPHNNAVIGNSPSNHGYAGFQRGATLVYLDETLSRKTFPISMLPQTPPRTPTPTRVFDSCIRPGELVAAISATGRLIIPGARVMPRLYEDVEENKNDTAPNQSFDVEPCDLEDVRNDTAVNQSFDDKPLENSDDIGRNEKTPKNISNLFTPKKISELFSNPKDESLGKQCYIHQYAFRHNLSYEEAEKKIEENGLFGKRVHRRRLGKKGKSKTQMYTKGCVLLPKQQYAKNYEGREEDFDNLDYDDPWERFNMRNPSYPTGSEEVTHEADYEDWSNSSSSYDATDSNVHGESEDSREYWPPAYPGQWSLAVGRKRKLNQFNTHF